MVDARVAAANYVENLSSDLKESVMNLKLTKVKAFL